MNGFEGGEKFFPDARVLLLWHDPSQCGSCEYHVQVWVHENGSVLIQTNRGEKIFTHLENVVIISANRTISEQPQEPFFTLK